MLMKKKKIKDTVHLPKCEVLQSTEKTGISVLHRELDTPSSRTISDSLVLPDFLSGSQPLSFLSGCLWDTILLFIYPLK